jgi:stage III sporulation protein AF
MINFLSNWIEGIVIAVIITSIFEMLLPEGNMKKYVKIVLGIYVVFSIISPFVDNKSLYSFDIEDTIDEYSTNITKSTSLNGDNDIENMYIDALEKEIIKKVEEQGYIAKECVANAIFDTSSENFGINNISISLIGKKKSFSKSDEKIESNEISNINSVNKVEIKVGNTVKNEEIDNSITDKDISDLKKYLSEYFEIDKSIIDIKK